MPLTETGHEVLGDFKKRYGPKKGESYFHATINKGNSGTEGWHRKKKARMPGQVLGGQG